MVSELVAPQTGLALSWVGTVAAASEIDLGFLRLCTLAERAVEIGGTVARGDVPALREFPGVDIFVMLLKIVPPVGRPVQYRVTGRTRTCCAIMRAT